jgi:geranylgeranylglycerol-phosphate geranylgeranyltransferase
MIIYSAWGKKTGFIGNLMVSTCTGLPFIYGGILSGSVEVALYFSILAFLSNTGREITKGIVDIRGDKDSGINTLAVSYGEKIASRIAALFFFASVGSSILPVFKNLVSFWYIPFIFITDLGLIHGTYSLLINSSRDNARSIKDRVFYLMLIGLAGFAAGSLI